MPPTNYDIEIRSEEVQDILSLVPSWPIRAGLSWLLLIIMLVLASAWYIPYPETVQAEVIIRPINPTTNIQTSTNKRIEKCHQNDGAMVNQGDTLLTFHDKTALIAPEAGRLLSFRLLLAGQMVEADNPLYAIAPADTTYVARLYVSSQQINQLSLGQRTTIELQEFAYQDYGVLEGTVSHIALSPLDGYYEVTVSLNEGLNTSYNIKLPPRNQLSGQATIQTKTYRLIQRIFRHF